MLNRRKFIKDTSLTAGALVTASVLTAAEQHDKEQKPGFLHGVASGDPLATAVIIWTRITTDKQGPVPVKWMIAVDAQLKQLVQTGETTAIADNDYTIKIDVRNLKPSIIYYFQFIAGDTASPVGKTRTTPADGPENLAFAVVSCSNYAAGYYNALARVAEKKDLNAVIHLGDYIYEGTSRKFDEPNNPPYDEFENTHFNRTREWWLYYYRRRYAINHLDVDLQAAHKAHPFITIWDDHEIANNAWKDGAQGHNTNQDGEWEIRKSAARQAYAEWMPLRGNAASIYRTIRYGKMADIILVDTRIEGRDQQIYDGTNPALYAVDRSILGRQQKDWLLHQLDNSPCQWKVIANQVIFSEVNVQWASMAGRFADKVTALQNTLLDYWEGYPAERDQLINHITKQKINDVVILSASMHCALAFDVTSRATIHSRKGQPATYDPVTGKGSVAVEFAATSITSENFDEKLGSFYASTFQSLINKKIPAPVDYNPNPHLKFADLQRHGYFILTLTKEKAEAKFYFVDDLMKKTAGEKLAAAWYTKTGRNALQKGAV